MATLDVEKLDQLAIPVSFVIVQGQDVPLIHPRGDLVEHEVFDAAICAAGLPTFLRPRVPSDLASDAPSQLFTSHVMVHEWSPGKRDRWFVEHYPFSSIN